MSDPDISPVGYIVPARTPFIKINNHNTMQIHTYSSRYMVNNQRTKAPHARRVTSPAAKLHATTPAAALLVVVVVALTVSGCSAIGVPVAVVVALAAADVVGLLAFDAGDFVPAAGFGAAEEVGKATGTSAPTPASRSAQLCTPYGMFVSISISSLGPQSRVSPT